MEIVRLLEDVRLNIEDNKIIANNVGNRPHYPVFVAFNGSDARCCTAFINNIQNTWSSQICRSLLFYRYTPTDDGVTFYGAADDAQVDIDTVYGRISEAARTKDIFAKREMWCLYNVIDTSEMTFEQFQTAYHKLNTFKEVIDERVRSMVIVILRDARAKERKAANYLIRDFLRSDTSYDGMVVVSNRARGGMEYSFEELYKMVSNLVLLSDNDAVSTVDDQSYAERILKLYSKTPLLMSYSSLSKPTNDILACMLHRFSSTVQSYIGDSDNKKLSVRDVEQIIGIENGNIAVFEGFFKSVKDRIEAENAYAAVFQYMPLNSPAVLEPKDMAMMSFAQLEGVNPESLELIAEEYCSRFTGSEEGAALLNQYSGQINDKLNLMNIKGVTEETVMAAFDDLLYRNGRPNPAEPVRSYFNQLILYVLKAKHIYPYCINLAKAICNEAYISKTEDNIERFRYSVDEALPVSGFDDISEFYGQKMSDYLGTDRGMERIKEFLKVGNTYEDLCRIAERTLYEANDFCDEIINMPFISIWANALKLHEGEVFGRIRNTLHGEGDDAILLRGAYPVKEELSVFMLHCYDRNGENNTELYSRFNQAYVNMSGVQFFNTGNDDSIESVKFYDCSGTGLVLGLQPAE